MAASSSLKAQNLRWLTLLATLDAVVILLLLFPEMRTGGTLNPIVTTKSLAISLLPVVVLLVTGSLSHHTKAVIVYWKLKDVMPGCEAFSRHGPADNRVDLKSLRKNVGALPSAPREQNAKWFKLYDSIRSEPAVAESHKSYLLYRDMAVVSLPLIALVPIGAFYAGSSPTVQWVSAAVFALQYLMSAVSARHSGIRFVCNVLAIHSARKVP